MPGRTHPRTGKAASRKRGSADPAGTNGPGGSVDLTQSKIETQPLMPNDRDEKVGMTGGVSDKRVQQGARDLRRGVQDTSRSTEAGIAYERQKK